MITEIGLQYFIALVEEIWRPWKIENQIEGANPDFYMVMYGKIARLWTDVKFLAIKIAFYDIMHQIYYSYLVHWGSFEDILPFTIFFSIMKSPTMVKITNWIVGYFSRTRQKVMQTELRTWTISAKLTKYNYAVYKTTLFCLRRQPSKSK